MKKTKLNKPRDPNAQLMAAIRRSGAMGAHTKSRKAERRKNKITLRKEYS